VVPWFGTADALHQYVVGAFAMFAAATLLTMGLAALGHRLRMSSDAERRMRDLLMGSPDGLIVTDSAGRIRMVNPAARQLLDVPKAALVGHDLESALEGVIGGSAGAGRLKEVVDGTRRRGTVRVGQGPSARWIEAARADVVDPDGTTGVQVSLREVTSHREALQEHRQLGGRLEHALRMEAVGRLAGGVAHSFNNLLTVIGGCAELLLDPEEPVEGLARDILEAKVRGAALTGQLLSFAQKDVVTLSLVSLSDVVRAMKPNLESFLTEGLRLQLELPVETPAVMGDRSQIEQVIMNLVINAKDAIAGVGTVTVGVYPPGAPRSWHTEEWWVPEGFVELDVEDDGVGMDGETRTRAFEPFFTTRPTGRGTGLGLSTVYGVVNQNGGEIRMLSQPGRGTSVVVLWPMASHREVA
jgi:PAS domain S-box-containing protein